MSLAMSCSGGTEDSDAAERKEREGSKLVNQKSSHTLLRSVAANLEDDLYCPDEDSIEKLLSFRHGLLLSHTLRLKGKIKNILYYPKDQAFKALHSEHVYHYCKENLVQAFSLNAGEKGREVERILYAAEHDEYIGVSKQGLLLFDSSFHVMYEVECSKQISIGTYNQWSGEVITAGVGYFQVTSSHILPFSSSSSSFYSLSPATPLSLLHFLLLLYFCNGENYVHSLQISKTVAIVTVMEPFH